MTLLHNGRKRASLLFTKEPKERFSLMNPEFSTPLKRSRLLRFRKLRLTVLKVMLKYSFFSPSRDNPDLVTFE
jgi:hypothetical protein